MSPTDDDGDVKRGGDDGESPKERLNRELDQLLNELRVALPGVQVLLAFLLTAPFSQGFSAVDDDGRIAYAWAVVFAAAASVLLISPTVHHRLRFRQGTKEQLVRTGSWLALAGVTCLGFAIALATYVLGDTAFDHTQARLLGPGVLVFAGVVWFGIPLRYRRTRPAGDERAERRPDLM